MKKNTSQTIIIAEAGVNHNGSVEVALKLIDAAAAAGADIVKFQTFRADAVVSRVARKAKYQIHATGGNESQLEMIRRLELTQDAHWQLIRRCEFRNIGFLSSPFDIPSALFLRKTLGLKQIKIPSGEITNGPLLLAIASMDCPVILSTGMSTLGEVEEALSVLIFGYLHLGTDPSREAFRRAYASAEGQSALRSRVTLLHCTSEYPAPYEEVNLAAMDTLKWAFGLPVGLSDHTEGIAIPIAAAARGAAVVEKHFTLDRSQSGPDHRASLEPKQLADMVAGIRQVEASLGDGCKRPSVSEHQNVYVVRKSLVAARNLRAGHVISEGDVTSKRPGNGISPMDFWEWQGRQIDRDFDEDEPIE